MTPLAHGEQWCLAAVLQNCQATFGHAGMVASLWAQRDVRRLDLAPTRACYVDRTTSSQAAKCLLVPTRPSR
jgi:hypothetical protein